jgi:hypothetical protein
MPPAGFEAAIPASERPQTPRLTPRGQLGRLKLFVTVSQSNVFFSQFQLNFFGYDKQHKVFAYYWLQGYNFEPISTVSVIVNLPNTSIWSWIQLQVCLKQVRILTSNPLSSYSNSTRNLQLKADGRRTVVHLGNGCHIIHASFFGKPVVGYAGIRSLMLYFTCISHF